jgi:hygromycin-B 7''-O-kinase
MLPETPLTPLSTIDGYRRHFMDVELWRPYVEAICLRHALLPVESVRGGLPGSCPAFIVNERWVVKLFGLLFGGGDCFLAEYQANQLVADDPAIPAPKLLFAGSLFEQPAHWHWPYLIFPFVPSISIGEVQEAVDEQYHRQVADHLGIILRRLHQLPLAKAPPLMNSWEPYRSFLQEQSASCASRHQQWGTLPKHLLDQIDTYLLPPDQLIDGATMPHLIHGDMTADHILGKLEENRWTTLAMIDFGDARVANLTYELVALHLDLFRGNKTLLHMFLESYGVTSSQRKLLPHQAMSVTLLHDFDVLQSFFSTNQSAHEIASLDQLAVRLWDTGSFQVR